MEHVCRGIDKMVSCKTCGRQTLPPYRLCLNKHVGCQTCAKYLAVCACGVRYAAGPHSTYDWIMTAMKFRCRYRAAAADAVGNDGDGGGGVVVAGGGGQPGRDDGTRVVTAAASAGDDCENRWFDVQELSEHYRSGCKLNAFRCPMDGCCFDGRVDTITEHYEAAHGPYTELTPGDDDDTYEVTFKLWTPTTRMKVIRKIFNGYLMVEVKPQPRRKNRETLPNLSIQNINPMDPLRYEYTMSASSNKEITVVVSLSDWIYAKV